MNTRWLKLLFALVMALGLIFWGRAYGQSTTSPRPLTWDDAPQTPILRHEGDNQVRLGRYSVQDALGPFDSTRFDVGDTTIFSIVTADVPHTFRLFYRSEYAYFWFEPESDVDMVALQSAATRFDTEIWPTVQDLFGESTSWGIDNDPRIHLVHLNSLYSGLAGFFSPSDQCAQEICAHSNQRDVLYLMLDYGPLDSELYLSTIAHELQHLFQFSVDGNEYRWLDEGYSQLAEHILGFAADPINQDNLVRYLQNTNIFLNGWSKDYDAQSIHYGAGYLMMVYLYERFGPDFIRVLTHLPDDGLAAIDRALQIAHLPERVNDVVLDWWIANYLNDPSLEDGRYGYETLAFSEQIIPIALTSQQSIVYNGTLYPYGVEYLHIERGTYQLTFSASTTHELIPQSSPHSGSAVWWTNNATASATTLTRAIDLRDVERATLKYWLLGEAGDFGGYLHLLASTNGTEWEVLRGAHMDVLSRFGNAPGPHYISTDGIWMADFVDLTPYVGAMVYVRFEYVTNNALADSGFFIDDFSIPELDWADDVESGVEDWEVQGFIRTNGQVEQQWAIALLDPTANVPIQIIKAEGGYVQANIHVATNDAVLLVGSLAPFTAQPSTYHLELKPS